MEFALLIYGDEKLWDNADPAARAEMYRRHGTFMAMLQERGAARGGGELAVTTTATTLRHGEDDVSVTDGPFAETAEQFGGFYLIEAPDLAEAIEIAKQLPADTVEVRPIVPSPDM